MEYLVIADAKISVDPGRFAAEWNRNEKTREVAIATTRDQQERVYDGGLTILLSVLGGIASGVASSAVYDLIKEALGIAMDDKDRAFELEIEERSDGTRIVRVRLPSEPS